MRYMVSLHPYSIEGFGRVRTVPTMCPAASATPIRTRSSCRTSSGSSGAVAVESDLLLHRGWPRLGAGPRARLQRRRGAPVCQVRRRRQPPHPRHLQQRELAQLRADSTTCATRRGTVRGERRPARDAGRRAAAHLRPRPHLPLLPAGWERMAARHRADLRRPAAHRLHAASTARTPSTTPITTARAGSATRSSKPDAAASTSPRAEQRSTTRTRASSTCHGRSASGAR